MDKINPESNFHHNEDRVDPSRLGNIIYFTGEITETSSYKFIYLLHQLEGEKSKTSDKDCAIRINSVGGSCTSGLLMYDALRSSSLDISILASGFIPSSATIVLLCAEKRFCTQNTNFLVHPVPSFMFGRLPDVKNQLAYGEILESQFVNIYQKHTKITKEMMQQETYFDSEKALNLQLISKII
jgi:ATP-dependent protease ClpP protease subunit